VGVVGVVAATHVRPQINNAPLLKNVSPHGPLGLPVVADDSSIKVGDQTIKVFAERDPKALPWRDLGVDVVIESTGIFTDGQKAVGHIDAGARRVIISAPATNVDATFVIGVNEGNYDPAVHKIVSNASCTTNCFVPLVKVAQDAFGIERGLMTTVHAYTNDQNLLDLAHKDPRRARAAAQNIVPSTTGAAKATALVMPEMKGLLDGTSLRVPVADGSITDATLILRGTWSKGDINEAYERAASSGPLSKVLVYSDEPLVSSDIVGNPASCIFDSDLTMVMDLGNVPPLSRCSDGMTTSGVIRIGSSI
jgi:glyceraldehyde 3-phosphate dehydrogenase